MVPAFEREAGGILDHRIEWDAAAQLFLDATVDDGAFYLRGASRYDNKQVEVRLTSVIASHARPEGVYGLQSDFSRVVLKTCSYRCGDSRQCLSCGRIH